MAYITHIHIENCRNIKTLDVDLSPDTLDVAEDAAPKSSERDKKAFRHLILTGPNGSGKSGVLKRLGLWSSTLFPVKGADESDPASLADSADRLGSASIRWVNVSVDKTPGRAFADSDWFVVYVPTQRDFRQEKVPGPSELQLDVVNVRPTKSLGNRLLQFLVNKRTEWAYAIADGDRTTGERIERWFKQLWDKIAQLMEDEYIHVSYDRQAFTFRFRRSDGYEFDLSTLADGHAAAFALIAEILLRIEASQRAKNDCTFEPEGIVIVDEIETHLHLSLQEQILPLLTTMFPKVQFIVATHSPAVIASIPDAVIYDLRRRKQFLSADYRGIPYGVLMTEHFGISSDVDLDSTRKLIRFRDLSRQHTRTLDENHEMEALAAVLSARSQILATEVWMVKERLGLSSVQLAGE